MTRTALYRYYSAEGDLLYVGVTDDLRNRASWHRLMSPWFSQIGRTETEWHEVREHALALEAVAIRYEKPLHNIHPIAPSTDEHSSVSDLLYRCGSRAEVLADVQRDYPEIKLVAVHRWFRRQSVPGQYWFAIVSGANARGVPIRTDDFALAHRKILAGAA